MPATRSPDKAKHHHSVELANKAELSKRLDHIEGQVCGIARTLEEDRYFPDVLTQIAAARTAMDAPALQLLEDTAHMAACRTQSVPAKARRRWPS